MSSTILYKFRSGTTFEALPLPGTAARLFDVKKAIIKAKKLDAGGPEFDLSVQDATTNEEYVDETMLLPRGTRLVVQRVPAARGHGFLARMARADSGMTAGLIATAKTTTAPSGFYTIDSAREDEEEFVHTGVDEEKELAALMAVTDPGTATTTTGGLRPTLTTRIAGSGPPPSRGPPGHFHYKQPNFRPNADPELRDQERVPKKRATGIPRTFLNLSAPPVTDASDGGELGGETVARLQPNVLGFEELVSRGGGQSEITTGTKRDLDYALKLTATSIPEHLQCGICHGVVKNAMLLPWDMEGRTACESCIRDALAQSGFRCPLTGMEGVSPDDLHPNYGLRKAAELFIKGVMEKMDEIQQQQVDDAEDEEIDESADGATLEGESRDKGVIVSRKSMKDHKRRHDDDPFGGGDDDFGGDVFDVAPDEASEENLEAAEDADDNPEEELLEVTAAGSAEAVSSNEKKDEAETESKIETSKPAVVTDDKMNKSKQSDKSAGDSPFTDTKPSGTSPHADTVENKRDTRRRGPPAGYAMGPAGGARRDTRTPDGDYGRGGASPYGGRGRGGDRAPSYRGRGRGRFFGGDHDGRGGRGYQQPRYDGRPEEVSQFVVLCLCA